MRLFDDGGDARIIEEVKNLVGHEDLEPSAPEKGREIGIYGGYAKVSGPLGHGTSGRLDRRLACVTAERLVALLCEVFQMRASAAPEVEHAVASHPELPFEYLLVDPDDV